jgi:hypothetical protein
MWRMTLGIWGEEDGGSRLLWRRAGWGNRRGNDPAGTVMPRMACPSRQQAPMEASAHKPQCSGCKRQLRGTVEQSLQNGTCKHMQMSVHSEINTAPKAALTLRTLMTSDRQQSVSTKHVLRLSVDPESFSSALRGSFSIKKTLSSSRKTTSLHYLP